MWHPIFGPLSKFFPKICLEAYFTKLLIFFVVFHDTIYHLCIKNRRDYYHKTCVKKLPFSKINKPTDIFGIKTDKQDVLTKFF